MFWIKLINHKDIFCTLLTKGDNIFSVDESNLYSSVAFIEIEVTITILL